jgi:hypothetical protein
MMSVVHANAVRFDSGSDSEPGLVMGERDRPRRELLEANRRLELENARLAEENHSLREAAALWIQLYEKQLERANRVAGRAR